MSRHADTRLPHETSCNHLYGAHINYCMGMSNCAVILCVVIAYDGVATWSYSEAIPDWNTHAGILLPPKEA